MNHRAHCALATSFVLTLTMLACQPDDPAAAGPGSAIRDSAGIRIVENPRPPDGSRLDWRIGPDPTVSIGEVDGEEAYMLQGARDATRLSDGRIVVADVLAQELRVFNARGIHTAAAIKMRAASWW